MNSWEVSSRADRLGLHCGSHELPQLPSALFLLPGGLYNHLSELRIKEIVFCCQNWAVQTEAKLCVQYGQIPASTFNFKSTLRNSSLSSLADVKKKKKSASYQIASIQVWALFYSSCMWMSC